MASRSKGGVDAKVTPKTDQSAPRKSSSRAGTPQTPREKTQTSANISPKSNTSNHHVGGKSKENIAGVTGATSKSTATKPNSTRNTAAAPGTDGTKATADNPPTSSDHRSAARHRAGVGTNRRHQRRPASREDQLKKTIEKLEREKVHLSESLNQAQEKLVCLANEAELRKHENEGVIKRLNSIIRNREAEILDLKDAVDVGEEIRMEREAVHQSEMAKLEQVTSLKVSTLESESVTQNNKCIQLSNELEQLREEHQDVSARLSLTQEHLDSAIKECSTSQERERDSAFKLLEVQERCSEIEKLVERERAEMKQKESNSSLRCESLEKNFHGTMEQLHLRVRRAESTLLEKEQQCKHLQQKLHDKFSRLETLDASIKEYVDNLIHHMNESAIMQGNSTEVIRWKTVKKQVEALRADMDTVFESLTARIIDKSARIKVLEQKLSDTNLSHANEVRAISEQVDISKMLSRVLQPVPITSPELRVKVRGMQIPIKLRDRPNYLPSVTSGWRVQDPRQEFRKFETTPMQLRARLLISSAKKEEVSQIIEKVREWHSGYSTIYLTCCKHCGVFFIDKDEKWPTDCVGGDLHEECLWNARSKD